jgi:predicted metal-dependent enzyme (double-stranded beta helix superfamily)
MVLQGAETEALYDIDGDHLVEIGKRQRTAGSVRGVAPPDDIHRVCNTGETGRVVAGRPSNAGAVAEVCAVHVQRDRDASHSPLAHPSKDVRTSA